MRNLIHSMTVLCVILSAFISHPASAADSNNGKKKEVLTSKKTKKEIATFFSDYLAGKETTTNLSKRIKLSDVQQVQKKIWEVWQRVNIDFPEQKIIALDTLEKAQPSKWELPSNLEVDAVMPYYWGSKGEKPENGYPLYIYTHGSGPKESEWATGLTLCKRFKDAPSAYFIPQIPNIGKYYRWWQKAKQFAWERLLRLAFVSGDINPDKVYFFGISEGGYGSQRLASFYADYLAAAGPMAGGDPLRNSPFENCRNIAFSLRTGANDFMFCRNKLTQCIKDEFDRLEQDNPGSFIHQVELIPNQKHGIDYYPTTPWLKQYTRNPYPKTVSWENFEMDGIYRKGFYNLVVKERSNDNFDTRTYYELTMKGNEINLKADIVTYQTTEKDPRWGMELKFDRSYQPATKGKVLIYLCQELVDLTKEITLTVNGKEAFKGMVHPNLKHIINSCATFFDPARLYPAAIEVDIANLK